MRSFLEMGFVAVAGCFLALPCQAYTKFECLFDKSGKREPGTINLEVHYDSASNQAQGIDSYSYDEVRNPDPVDIQVKRHSATELRLVWSVPDVRKGSYSSDLDYQASINPATGALDITITPVSYPQTWHFTGKCAISKVK